MKKNDSWKWQDSKRGEYLNNQYTRYFLVEMSEIKKTQTHTYRNQTNDIYLTSPLLRKCLPEDDIF